MQHLLKLDDEPDDKSKAQPWPFADYAYPTSPQGWNGAVLVGEAPGAEEARLGRPFVGRSGQLLDKMLEQAGIDRSRCIIANVFRFRPPANKVDHFFISRRAASAAGIAVADRYGQFGSAWVRADFAREIDHLRDMLGEKRPKIIIALGRTPLWALTGESALLAKAGQTLPCRLSPGLTVLPTFHPSFILRGNWKLQDQWLSHFIQVANYIK